MSREKWATLPEVEDTTGGEITIGDIGLPYGMDHERLQLNVDALRRGVINFGGYNALVLTSYAGERDEVSHQITGINSDGSATGVRVKASAADLSDHSSIKDEFRNSWDIRNGVLFARVNSTALNDRTTSQEQFNPDFKASQLSKAFKPALIKAVWEHNTREVLRSRPVFFTALMGGIDSVYLGNLLTLSIAYKDYAALGAVAGLRMSALKLGFPAVKTLIGVNFRENINDYQFLTVRPTRAAAAAGLLAAKRLLRPTPLATES